jgi:hypothetical protein
MASKKTMLLVTDAAGRILAAAHPADGKSSRMNVGISPLAGQEIHQVEIPEEVARLKSGHDFHMALCHAKFHRETGKMEFPEVSYKKVKH